MPNFSLSAQLRQNFAPSSKPEIIAEGRRIALSLSSNGTEGTKAFSALQIASPTISRLVTNPNTELALLYIDITNFSVKTAGMTASQITRILDAYYADVLPVVYEFNGEVEKIMGDGIIAVFGPPFTPGSSQIDWLRSAEKCADKIGQQRYRHEHTVKIALHYGKLMYYRNDKTTVDEFYAIGQPMTELFRLESEGIDKKITYYVGGAYDSFRQRKLSGLTNWWTEGYPRPVSLKGVTYNKVIDLS